MRTLVEIDDSIKDDEVIIRCRKLDDKITKLQKEITRILSSEFSLTFYDAEKEYYLDLDMILFFETEYNYVFAYTKDNSYKVKYKLYELESILPRNFIRVSKSTILNLNQIYSISQKFASSNLVEFYNSSKQVFISRHYYKELRERLKERK